MTTVVVGGGLAGLVCARSLAASGEDVRVLERSDRPGGVVRTERREGFLFDGGRSHRLLLQREGWQSILSVSDLDGDGLYEIVSDAGHDCVHDYRVELFDGKQYREEAETIAAYGED